MQDIELDMDFMAELEELSAIPCDVSAETNCPLEAEWAAVTACCGFILLICQEHYEAMLALMEKKELVMCQRCPTMGSFNIMITSIERL